MQVAKVVMRLQGDRRTSKQQSKQQGRQGWWSVLGAVVVRGPGLEINRVGRLASASSFEPQFADRCSSA